MAKDRPADILVKYRKALNLDEHWDLSALVNAGNIISDFKIFINKSLIQMEVSIVWLWVIDDGLED